MNANIPLNVQYIERYVLGEEMTDAERKKNIKRIKDGLAEARKGFDGQPWYDEDHAFLLSELDRRDEALRLMLKEAYTTLGDE